MFVNYVNYIINSVIVVLECCRVLKYFYLGCVWEGSCYVMIWFNMRYVRNI